MSGGDETVVAGIPRDLWSWITSCPAQDDGISSLDVDVGTRPHENNGRQGVCLMSQRARCFIVSNFIFISQKHSIKLIANSLSIHHNSTYFQCERRYWIRFSRWPIGLRKCRSPLHRHQRSRWPNALWLKLNLWSAGPIPFQRFCSTLLQFLLCRTATIEIRNLLLSEGKSSRGVLYYLGNGHAVLQPIDGRWRRTGNVTNQL